MEIVGAKVEDLDRLVPLFEGYRQFYRAAPDPAGARKFLAERLQRGDSTILLAIEDGEAIGFIQLYPLFSSVSMQPVLVLNDLFVIPEVRRSGAGAKLIDAAERFAHQAGVSRLRLSTQRENLPAQNLYEGRGWKHDNEFRHYNRAVPSIGEAN